MNWYCFTKRNDGIWSATRFVHSNVGIRKLRLCFAGINTNMSEIASLVITRLTLDTLRANFLSTYPYFSFAEARRPPDNHNHRVPIESRIWSFVVISLLFPFVFGLQSLQLKVTRRHVLSHDEKLGIMQPAVLFMNSNYWKAYMLLEESSWLLSLNTIESSMSSLTPSI